MGTTSCSGRGRRRRVLRATCGFLRKQSHSTAGENADQCAGIFQSILGEQMRRHNANEFARRDYLCPFPKSGKVADVSRNQIVGASRIGALNKYVVAGIARDL